MYTFIIVDGFPFLFDSGKTYRVRWNEEGFTIGDEIKLDRIPEERYSNLSIKCRAKYLNSIDDYHPAEEPAEAVQEAEKPKRRSRRKAEDL